MAAPGPARPPYDAVVLAGGSGRRLGGADKGSLRVGGRSLLVRVADAVADAGRLIVVGPTPPGPGTLHPRTVLTREEPPGAGPVAALGAGVVHVTAPHVAVLAVDLPFLTSAAVRALRRALEAAPVASAVLPVDGGGRDQLLCSLWRSDSLRGALAGVGDLAGVPVRRLLDGAPGTIVRLDHLAPRGTSPPPWFDCDTPADLAEAERWRGGGEDRRS